MPSKIIIRKAEIGDRMAFWEWRNDQVTRRMFRLDKSVSYSEHCAWYEGLLDDDQQILVVGLVDTIRIGSIRFRRDQQDNFQAELYLKPAYCGRQNGVNLLLAAIEYLSKTNVQGRVWSTSAEGNILTGAIFEEAGFSQNNRPNGRPTFSFHLHTNSGVVN